MGMAPFFVPRCTTHNHALLNLGHYSMNLLHTLRIIGFVVPAVALSFIAPGVFAHHEHNDHEPSPNPVATCHPDDDSLLFIATPEVYELANQ